MTAACGQPAPPRQAAGPGRDREGAALIVALWILLLLAIMVGSFAYDMHIEAHVTAYYRQRLKSQYLARGGVEWAKLVLAKSNEVSEDDEVEEGEDENVLISAINLSRGVGVSQRTLPMSEGTITVDLLPEQGRYNVNQLSDEQWEEILDYSNIPQDRWDELIDCFTDWVDDNDAHLLNGAESEDPFYEERGYLVKNGQLDTISELSLIKGFDHSVVYGGPGESEDDPPLLGVARLLTTWGDGRINVNTASRDVLMTLPGLDEVTVEGILEQRLGEDGEAGTRDDGFESIEDFLSIPGVDAGVIGSQITVDERRFVRVVSVGEVEGVRSGIWAVFMVDEERVLPLYWREEQMQ
jgi:general secretion pathway protein K